jgi:DNA-binding MarR family transcriptional regulator
MFLSPDECAREVVEVVPLIMRALVGEMRRHDATDLSVPQFATLAFLSRNEGACLSDAAEHFGLRLPSMSKMIDGLVVRGLVLRSTNPTDRRRVTLALSESGRDALQVAREATRVFLAERLSNLTASQLAAVVQTMGVLRPLFDGGSEADDKASGQGYGDGEERGIAPTHE